MGDRELERLMMLSLGSMEKSQEIMAKSMENIEKNLHTLNDQNILHATENAKDHESILMKLQFLTGKYWWLIVSLIAVLLITAGLKDAGLLFTAG